MLGVGFPSCRPLETELKVCADDELHGTLQDFIDWTGCGLEQLNGPNYTLYPETNKLVTY